jgi:hypothetical protein
MATKRPSPPATLKEEPKPVVKIPAPSIKKPTLPVEQKAKVKRSLAEDMHFWKNASQVKSNHQWVKNMLSTLDFSKLKPKLKRLYEVISKNLAGQVDKKGKVYSDDSERKKAARLRKKLSAPKQSTKMEVVEPATEPKVELVPDN